jgi:hypothetical protein
LSWSFSSASRSSANLVTKQKKRLTPATITSNNTILLFNKKKMQKRNQYWSASTGNKPQNTIGVASSYPGSELSAFLKWWVIVSPTLASATVLIDADR